MPITTKHGSIFDSRAQVLVCPVNCVGVMGAGLAKEFKRRLPEMFRAYKDACKHNNMLPGDYSVWENKIGLAFTKRDWRNPSQLRWVDLCLYSIAVTTRSRHHKSIAIPQLGCGCGGLDWADVEPLYHKHLGGLDCDVEVWIYEGH